MNNRNIFCFLLRKWYKTFGGMHGRFCLFFQNRSSFVISSVHILTLYFYTLLLKSLKFYIIIHFYKDKQKKSMVLMQIHFDDCISFYVSCSLIVTISHFHKRIEIEILMKSRTKNIYTFILTNIQFLFK